MIYHDGSHDLNGLEKFIEKSYKALKPHSRKFDVIIVQGMSGVVVGLPVALKLNKPLVIVRKAGDTSHSGCLPINAQVLRAGENGRAKRALFLDDFVSMGNTRRKCKDVTDRANAKLVGTYCYAAWNPDKGRRAGVLTLAKP